MPVVDRVTVCLISDFILTSCIHVRLTTCKPGDRGGTVVKVLCYKSEGRWFDPSWCH